MSLKGMQKFGCVSHLKRRSPADRTNNGGVEGGEIDETVGSQEEVGNQRSNGVQFGDDNAAEGYDESKDVASNGFIILSVTLAERFQIRVQFILAQSLEHFGSRDQTS